MATDKITPGFGQTNRRDFLKITGTGVGLMLICSATMPLARLASAQEHTLPFPKDFNAYIHVEPNGRISCFVGKVEIGSGQKTALTQCCADELDVDLKSVDMVLGDTELCPWDIGTFGSLTFNQYHLFFRAALAEARAVLLAMASEKLKTPVSRLRVKNGVVSAAGAAAKSISYAAMVEGKRIDRHIQVKIPTKTPVQFKVMGTSVLRLDGIDKVTGKAKYAADLGMPGTLHARVVRPSVFGAKLKAIDTRLAEVAGIKVVRDGDFVALLHEKPDVVDNALGLVQAEWQHQPDGLDDRNIFAHLLTFADKFEVLSAKGDLTAGEKLIAASADGKSGVVERSYTTASAYHAPMETHTNVARFENGKLTVWAATQIPFLARDAISRATKLESKNVRVIAGPYVGGGFGGKSMNTLDVVEVAKVAMLMPGRTIQIVWSRPEDIMHNGHRPAAVMSIRAGLTKEGKVSSYNYKVYGAGDGSAETHYDFPNRSTSLVGHWFTTVKKVPAGMQPFNVGPWRAPAVVSNVFAHEVYMDELAALAGADPVQFRIRHLQGEPRLRRVLEAAVKQFGYKPAAKAPSGRGIGVACGWMKDTFTCAIAQVEVDAKTGAIRVLRIVNAVDAGVIVNPVGATMQVEGCTLFGIGTALAEELRFRNGVFATRNFDSYDIPRFSWLPRMEVVLVKSPLTEPLGIGEPPISGVAPAIANAVYDATGARLRHLPMTPERVMAAMKKT